MPVNETRWPSAMTSLRLLQRAAEAVEDAAHAPRVIGQDAQRVVPRIALVDDGVEAELDGEVELRAEKLLL